MNPFEVTNEKIVSKLNFESIFYNTAYILFAAFVLFKKDWLFYIGSGAVMILTVTHFLVLREYNRLPQNEKLQLKKRIRFNTIFNLFELIVYIGNFLFIMQ